MVRRSLVGKIYAYTLAVVVGYFLLTVVVHLLQIHADQSMLLANLHRSLTIQADFIARAAEGSWGPGGPDPEVLKKAELAMEVKLRYVPWPDGQAVPEPLAFERVWQESPDRIPTPPIHPPALMPFLGVLFSHPQMTPGQMHEPPFEPGIYWARLEHDGRNAGALRVDFSPQSGKPEGGPVPEGPHGGSGQWPLVSSILLTLGWVLLIAMIIGPPLLIWVVRPLRRLVETAGRLGGGDLATPVPVAGDDEFGTLERAFESMRERLYEQMAQREQLLRDVSHELRSPLARMSLAADLMADKGRVQPYIGDLQEDMREMDALLGEILLLLRTRAAQVVEREQVDLRELTEQLAQQRKHLLQERSLALETDLQPVTVLGDRRLLARAVSNLLDNAIKYTGAGGSIRAETGRNNDGNFVAVSDTGIGIPADHLARICEPFYRVDPSRNRATGGVGLGLAIVKAVMVSHGGELRFTSTEGKGTKAELLFP